MTVSVLTELYEAKTVWYSKYTIISSPTAEANIFPIFPFICLSSAPVLYYYSEALSSARAASSSAPATISTAAAAAASLANFMLTVGIMVEIACL